MRICKVITPQMVVVQRKSTNTVMTLRLQTPIPDQSMASALQTTVFDPIDARVRLGGQYDESRHVYVNCLIVDAKWPKLPSPQKTGRVSWFS